MVALGLSVAAVSLTDLQSDEQSQRTTKIFGNYSAEALTLPDQLVCVLRQLWKPEFLGQGNVHVTVDEKKCFGNGEGDEEITAIVNLSIDPATGNTIGKVWYDDQASSVSGGNDVIVYIKGVVSAPPSASEPYGRFDISVVEQLNNRIDNIRPDAVNGDRLSTMRIIATGNVFKFVAETLNYSTSPTTISTFSSFSDRSAKRAAYKNSNGITVISYDSSHICFKTGSANPGCFLINDPNADQLVGSYGLYDAAGTRILRPITGTLSIDNARYTMPSGFAGPIFAGATHDPNDPGDLLGLVSSSTAATLDGSPIKVTWLARTLTNPVLTGTNVSLSTSMNADTTLLLDATSAGVLVDIRSEIGPLPRNAIGTSPRARAGKIL